MLAVVGLKLGAVLNLMTVYYALSYSTAKACVQQRYTEAT